MTDNEAKDNEPVPVEEGSKPQPVPVPAPEEPQSVEEEELSAISLVDEVDLSEDAHMETGGSSGLQRKTEFKRDMNITGNGATRCRIFNARVAANPLQLMENNINGWIDENGIEVKHVCQTLATLEGKTSEPNLFVMVWY